MKFTEDVGIVAYGTALPSQVVPTSAIELSQGKENSGIPQSLGVVQKTVPAIDEDTITLATEAASQALLRFEGDKQSVGAIFIGSESHPYAVKPSSATVKEALDLPLTMFSADLQFACKAGTAALQIGASFVAAKMQKLSLAIGADTAQSRPGDVLEFTAGAGAAAFLLGGEKILANLVATTSVITDTPDFWRRSGQSYPEHAGRFSGEPGYFTHITVATKNLLQELSLTPTDVDWCVFHTPNAKFPQVVAKRLGFTSEQLKYSLIVKDIGNTYAAASLLGLVNVLDHAKAHQRILLTSYGSGSGSDAFLFETTDLLVQRRKEWKEFLFEKIAQLSPLTYEEYRAHRDNH